MTEYILLGFLMERDMTGYEMKQHMSISTSYFVDASYGSIYPSLKRLGQKGLVECNETIENGKLKKTYSINEQGKAVFLKWLESPILTSTTDISTALAKVFFFRHLPQEKSASLIEQCVRDLACYKESLIKLRSKVADQADPFELCTLDFGLDCYDFAMRWCSEHLLNKAE